MALTEWGQLRSIRQLQAQQLKLQKKAMKAAKAVPVTQQSQEAIRENNVANKEKKQSMANTQAKQKANSKIGTFLHARWQEEQEMVSKLSEREQEEYYREKLQARKDLPKKIIIGIICYLLFGVLIIPLLLSLLKS